MLVAILLLIYLFFKFYDAIKVVNIHKNNKFGMKNWPMFLFMVANRTKSKEKKDNNKHCRGCLLLFKID